MQINFSIQRHRLLIWKRWHILNKRFNLYARKKDDFDTETEFQERCNFVNIIHPILKELNIVEPEIAKLNVIPDKQYQRNSQ
jgi:hypothetical protein